MRGLMEIPIHGIGIFEAARSPNENIMVHIMAATVQPFCRNQSDALTDVPVDRLRCLGGVAGIHGTRGAFFGNDIALVEIQSQHGG